MKVTSKGQVTIPQEIRSKLGIDETCEVEFKEKDGKVFIEKAGKSLKPSRIRSLKGVASLKMSTEKIMALTRK